MPAGFTEGTQTLENGTKLHYVRGGTGEPVVLIHGFHRHLANVASDSPGPGEGFHGPHSGICRGWAVRLPCQAANTT